MLLTAVMMTAIAPQCVLSAENGKEPTMVRTSYNGTNIAVSWKNPEDGGLSEVLLFDEEGEKIDAEFSADAGAICKYREYGLTNGTRKQYSLQFTYDDGSVRKIQLADKTDSDNTRWFGDGWKITVANGIYGDNKHDQFVYDVDSTMYTGDSTSSMKIQTNTPDSITDWGYPVTLQYVGRKAGKAYTLSFDYYRDTKVENAAGGVYPTDYSWNLPFGNNTSGEWKHFSQHFGPDATIVRGDMWIRFAPKGTVWIDNLSLVEDGGDVNMLASYNTEALKAAAGGTGSIAAESGNGQATISWNGNSQKKKMNIYSIENGEEILMASVLNADETVTLDGLENGKEYTFIAKNCGNMIESTPSAEVKVTPRSEPAPNPESPQPDDDNAGEAVSAMTNAGNDSITVSWRNPVYTSGNADTVKKVSLYEKKNGVYELVKNDFSTSSGAAQSHKFSDLTLDTSYAYKLIFEFENFRTLNVYLSDKTTKEDRRLGTGTVYWNVEGDYAKIPFNVSVDTSEHKGDGSTSSVRIHGNSGQNTQFTGVANIPWQKISFAAEKKYRIEYDYKSNGSKGGIFLLGDWEHVNYIGNGTQEWQHTSQDFKYQKGVSGFFLKLNFPLRDLWIDNLAIHELDADGNITGDNLVEEYSSENILEKSETDSVEIKAEPLNRGAKVTWKGTSSCDKLNIYAKKGDKLYLRAAVSAGDGETEIGTLSNGEEYEIIAKPVKNGIEFDAKSSVTIIPEADKYETTEFRVTDSSGNEAVNYAAGKYTAEIRIKNNGIDEEFTAQLIAAVYSGKKLIGLQASEVKTIEKTPASEWMPDKISVPFEVKGAADRVCIYLWDSISGMTSLKTCR